MSLQLDAPALRVALAMWCDALDVAAPELNALDAQLGDGDLGTTLQRCAVNVRQSVLGGCSGGLAATLKACAQACAKASGSSFGTLLAVAFLTAGKAVGDDVSLDRATLVRVLREVHAALAARGGANPGDKTMLDSLAAITHALDELDDTAAPDVLARAATGAAQAALDAMRQRPNRIGRARMFAERSVGLDDPGMVAVLRMAQAL